MKRATTLALVLSLCTTACATADAPNQVELIVFAAASMTEALEEIAGLYAVTAPNVKLVLNFDSSGTLKTQIQEGADCDLFLSAGQQQMDQLDAAAPADVNTERLDFVLQGTRVDLLENKIALVVPSGNPKRIGNFAELAAALSGEGGILMAMGNSDVPVGQYTLQILEYLGLDEQALADSGAITYASNVKDVTTQVAQASVDCGVVYSTDARSAGLDAVDLASVEMCGRVVYPAAVLKTAKQPVAAKAFLAYLSGDEATAVFKKAGFSEVQSHGCIPALELSADCRGQLHARIFHGHFFRVLRRQTPPRGQGLS